MPTRRGWAVLSAGLSMWVAARLLGASDLHMMAVGLVALPVLAVVFVRVSNPRIDVRRHLSTGRASLGARVTASISVTNHGRTTTSFLLLEDSLPPSLGASPRMVVSGIPPRCDQTVTYSFACRQRGRYSIGPLTIFLTDPFGLAQARFDASTATELIVYPEIEDVSAGGLVTQGAGAGEAAVRHLYRSAAEFYTMREYVQGDDLRRIHWPSVARTGLLMIRQDESTRRSSAIVFLDTRQAALGALGSPGFERAVSVGATLSRALVRAGFALRLATADAAATPVTEEAMLESLAGITPSRSRSLAPALGLLRSSAPSDTTVALVTGPPVAAETSLIIRSGSAFGRKIAIIVQPVATSRLPAQAASDQEGRASAARVALQRAGWDVYVLAADGKLATIWRRSRINRLQAAARSS